MTALSFSVLVLVAPHSGAAQDGVRGSLAHPTTRAAGLPHLIADVDRPIALRVRPNGPLLTRLGTRTVFGSARALAVLARSGRWLQVATADLPSGRDGWVEEGTAGLGLSATSLELVVHLRSRTLDLQRGTVTVRRFAVGVGASSSPTPTGRFAVTDKLSGRAFSSVYGCCVLALSARQVHLPSGWRGGDRIAIHGTNAPGTIGQAESTGCIHARAGDLRYLMARVPLGTPVVIES